jgi:hypothetical protein
MAALVKVKVCRCVVATNSIHIKSVDVQIKNTALKTQRRVSNKNLPNEHDSRIMGLRVCEDVMLPCTHAVMLPCTHAVLSVTWDNLEEKQTFSDEDYKDVHMNLVTVGATGV